MTVAPEALTPAEAQVLDLLCEGMSAKEIAKVRGVSFNTVEVQVKQLRAKRDVPSTLKLVVGELKSRLAA